MLGEYRRMGARPSSRAQSCRSLTTLATGVIAVLVATSPAAAGGSISLTDVLAAAKGDPSLAEEVAKSLEASKTGEDDVVCSATRLGRHFDNLGGERIAPYECEIGDRVLEIDAKVHMFDAEGREIDLGDPDTPAKAAEVKEDGFVWRWRDKAKE